MSASFSSNNVSGKSGDLWDSPVPVDRAVSEPQLTVDVDGFEGPLDLLLTLARSQKVDLAAISMLDLANQYLEFIEEIRKIRLELAADYLVMASWLAYLKSRLLLPDLSDDEEPTGEELANQLAFRLQRLEAMREASQQLIQRNRLGQNFFCRGDPEPVHVEKRNQYSATLYDLLTAYAAERQRRSVSSIRINLRQVYSLQEARDILVRLIGNIGEWARLDIFLLDYLPDPEMRSSILASSFAASLELVREGAVEIRQSENFAPLFIRMKPQGESTDALATNGA